MHRKPCNDATVSSLWRASSDDFAKFPVKFPVSRENGQSRGLSALRRQPASPVSTLCQASLGKNPAVGGLLALGGESLGPEFDNSSTHCAENLHASSALFPFSGESSRRLSSIALCNRDGSPIAARKPSASGHELPSGHVRADSVHPLITDIRRVGWLVRFVPEADVSRVNHPRQDLVRSMGVCPASPPTPSSPAGALS